MSSSHLPLEVVEEILIHLVRIPFVYNSQNSDLLACALVSRTWLGAARGHMWDFDYFTIPRTQCKFTTLKRLYASPLCSLQLDKISDIWADPHNPLIPSFFEWCPPVFTGINRIEIKPHGPSFDLEAATLQKRIISAELPSLKSLRLYKICFTSIDGFYEFLSSLKGLEHLQCHDVHLENREAEGPDKLLTTPNVLMLDVDLGSFFELFYQRVVLSGLQVLVFEEPFGDCFHGTRGSYSDTRRWSDIGDMLAYTGHCLVRLKLCLLRKIGVTTLLSDVMDLPTKAPMLRELEVEIGDLINSDKLLPPMLSFKQPHLHLSTLKICRLPDDPITFDRILERSIPRLQALTFSAPGVVQRDIMGARWHIKLDDLQEGSLAWNTARKYVSDVGDTMPWCNRRRCLFPVFLSSELWVAEL
ncbi:hypothetical protein Moror_16044 [Moniliophthora roreri MCA 2997]|uniref:Uncharacterized protein n=1 Tax=Moniliophthora roreri (strain MCA 2997) TaxID=1381753 RepID=V2XG12_MONRO|nr:hypothetical protein Moror_16044 [Moniliophthora roreri MCA 2997]